MSPSKGLRKCRQEFDETIQSWIVPDGAVRENESTDKPAALTPTDLGKNQDRTNFHLRMAEIIRDHSRQSSLVLMTLPMPKKADVLPYGLYLAWLDIMTRCQSYKTFISVIY